MVAETEEGRTPLGGHRRGRVTGRILETFIKRVTFEECGWVRYVAALLGNHLASSAQGVIPRGTEGRY